MAETAGGAAVAQQQQQHDSQSLITAAAAAAAGGSSHRRSWRQRVVRWSIAAIQAVLLLELAVIGAGALMPQSAAAQSGGGRRASDDSDDVDPADVLVDVLSGRRSLTALQQLTTEELKLAVEGLVTEDYVELGMTDGGAELRGVVDDIIKIRLEGPPKKPEPERVGLGRVGPLRFRNAGQQQQHSQQARSSKTPAASSAADDASAAKS